MRRPQRPRRRNKARPKVEQYHAHKHLRPRMKWGVLWFADFPLLEDRTTIRFGKGTQWS